MRETTAQAGGLHQDGQWYWGIVAILGIFLVLVFVMEVWEIAKLTWDVLEKFYFGKEKFFL